MRKKRSKRKKVMGCLPLDPWPSSGFDLTRVNLACRHQRLEGTTKGWGADMSPEEIRKRRLRHRPIGMERGKHPVSDRISEGITEDEGGRGLTVLPEGEGCSEMNAPDRR